MKKMSNVSKFSNFQTAVGWMWVPKSLPQGGTSQASSCHRQWGADCV